MNISQFVYPVSFEYLADFQFGPIIKNKAMHMYTSLFSIHTFPFLLGKHLGVGLLCHTGSM